jgi:hypothetical protein
MAKSRLQQVKRAAISALVPVATSQHIPGAVGQLVWCPSDPSLGIGLITERDGSRIRVKFDRLQEERLYTTRTRDLGVVRYSIAPGERVSRRAGGMARVAQRLPDAADGCGRYRLDDQSEVPEGELLPKVRDAGAKERLASLNLVHPEVVRARLHGLQLASFGQRPGHAAVLGARVAWLPHQIDVASRAIERDPVRMVLADEVGLGKTVEAALIYAGLRHEGRAKRVLILTPESLTVQWLGEVYRKAHELLVLLDAERLEDANRDFPELSPFEAYQRMVVSLDRLVDDDLLAGQLDEVSWDLVICDEAHHLRWRPQDGGNTAYKIMEVLARRSRHLLLLTATPMALDPVEYHALLRLLDPMRFDDPAAFSAVSGRAASLRELALAVGQAQTDGTKLEAASGRALLAMLKDDPEDQAAARALLAKDADRQALAAPVMEALRERHGFIDYVVRNRRGPVGGMPNRVPHVVPLTPSAAQETLLDVGEAVMFDLAQEMPEEQQSQALGELLRALWATPRALVDILRPYSASLVTDLQPAMDAVVQAPLDELNLPTGDVRLRWLVQLLRQQEAGDKVLVFVESAVAVRALRDALAPLIDGQLAMFHRELAPRDQDRQVAWFRDPQGPRVMLCTEAGGEGRNFQFCHQVVLYDLPWRPATVEQRIGRIDRVGQNRDVHVWVPYFSGGYEAAVLKVMQQSIGVLQRTVGGIDHALEYVSQQLAALMLQSAGTEAWQALFESTHQLVEQARQRIDAAADPILDHASFSPERAAALLQAVPKDLEARTAAFVRRYAEHSRLDLHSQSGQRVAVEHACGAAGRETIYTGTFDRHDALDHEDVEFLSFGHPLITQACQWAEQAEDASAALALLRGCSRDGAVFIWSFGLDLPDDQPAARTYFLEHLFTFALDESGKRQPEFEALMGAIDRPLERMDPSPLRGAQGRWQQLCSDNFSQAEEIATAALQQVAKGAAGRATEACAKQQRQLRRAQRRALLADKLTAPGRHALEAEQQAQQEGLTERTRQLLQAIAQAQPSLKCAIALRLVRERHVST